MEQPVKKIAEPKDANRRQDWNQDTQEAGLRVKVEEVGEQDDEDSLNAQNG